MTNSCVLLTGGTGYIGSHTAVALLESGFDVVIVDNLSNSDRSVVGRIEAITGRSVDFHQVDVRDRKALERIFSRYRFDAVLHFAGFKAVGESVEKPLLYYENNVCGSVALLEAMMAAGVKRFVFSSSATVYGEAEKLPISEDSPLKPANPYGRSKLFVEEILKDQAHAKPDFAVAVLRYFNPVGAHPSGLIGERPRGTPNNLMPYIAQVATGQRDHLRVFGDDYPTVDGTGVRDYIHVMDLAQGHVAALRYLMEHAGFHVWNLGTGRGYSVLEMIRAFEKASGRKVPYRIVDRRPGDVAVCYADPARAHAALGWQAEKGLDEMCADTWRWESRQVSEG